MNTIQKIELDTAKLLINGQFIESKTQEWQDIVNPCNSGSDWPRAFCNG